MRASCQTPGSFLLCAHRFSAPADPSNPLPLPCLQALSYLNAKCSDNYMRALVSNSLFAHVSSRSGPAGQMLCHGAMSGRGWFCPLWMLCCGHPLCQLHLLHFFFHLNLQFRQTLESVVRNGSSSPKLAALVQTLRQHFQARVGGTGQLHCLCLLGNECGRGSGE